MKRNLITFIILAVLGAAAYLVYFNHGSGTIKPDLHDFAVTDTGAITKIFLADRAGSHVLLERKDTRTWTLNSGHKARKDAIDMLLKTIARVEMKSPVSSSARDNIVRVMAGKSTKVEIYEGDEKVKTYYVGDGTKDNLGTYMLIEGSGTPFVCTIPGFYGYLTPRYFTHELEWRDTEIFKYRLSQIAEVKVDFFDRPEGSFRITHGKNRKVRLFRTFPKEEPVEKMDTIFVKRYLLNYKNVRFEGIQPYDAERVDSIVNSPKYFTISLTDHQGNTRSVTAYRIPADPGSVDAEDKPLIWDPDRMHGVVNGNKDEIVLIQYFTFDHLTIDISKLQTDPLLRRDN